MLRENLSTTADSSQEDQRLIEGALDILNAHHHSFMTGSVFALATGQPTPEDSRAWSQILVSALIGIPGPARKKGPDLLDGSDVKAATTWDAIDTPRFNGVIKAGTLSSLSGNMSYLDTVPNLYLVLWDNNPIARKYRVRIWVVQPKVDPLFREMCSNWYSARTQGIIKSANFQLHPPRNIDSNVITNTCGNLSYPLLFSALWEEEQKTYQIETYNKSAISSGFCTRPV